MLILLLEILGLLPVAEAPTAKGPIVANTTQTVQLTRNQSTTLTATGFPLGAPKFAESLDPSDIAPFAFDFSDILGSANIARINRVTMSATGVAAGVQIIDLSPRIPTIDIATGKIVQVWLNVADAHQSDGLFTGSGFAVAVSIEIQTDASIYEVYERTGIVTVRQL